MIILDTNVVSEPLKPKPNPGVLAWLGAQAPDTLYVTTITIAEMTSGVEKMPKGRRREALSEAIDEVFALFDGRVLVFDVPSAKAFGKLLSSANSAGNPIGFSDAAIAGIAAANDFAIATGNGKDFRGTKVRIINPWE